MAVQTGQSHSWWFASQDRFRSSAQSSWLSTTISELEEKTRQMLNLIEEEADSFAKRAEIYYKKRPQLMNMIEDFYRTHRSLAERYDQLKSRSGARRSIAVCPSYFCRSWPHGMNSSETDELSKSSTDSFDSEGSEIDDPEEEIVAETKLRTTPYEGSNGHLVKLKQELERFKEENAKLKVEIAGKNEEKREVIRQLALSLDILMEENVTLRKCLKDLERKGGFFELKKLTKDMFSGKMFRGRSKNQTLMVAL